MRFRPADWILLVCILAGTAVLVRLGFWQVQRLGEKEAMIARAENNSRGAPIPYDGLFPLEETGEDLEYRPVTVRGRFLHDREMYFVATFEGQPGRYVYTPLRRPDGAFVWVNRGFVPQDRIDPATRPGGQVEGEVTVTGLARMPLQEAPNSLVPDNEPLQRTFYWKDRDAMTEAAELEPSQVLPFFVDAARGGEHAAPFVDGRPGLPVGGVTQIAFSNNHLQYIVTWWGLALCLVGVGGVFLWRRVSGRTDPDARPDADAGGRAG